MKQRKSEKTDKVKVQAADDHIHLHMEGQHSHDDHHSHTHVHTQTKAVLNRMARIIGHMTAVRGMVENGRDCSEVLIQLAAVNAAVTNVSKVIMKDHLEHCIVEAAKENDTETIDKLKSAIDKFIK